MGLFDVDALESYLEKRLTNKPELFGWLCARLADIPTIDAVEVVRCKDCKYYGWEQDPCHGRTERFCKSNRGLAHVTKDSFCSYGKRKEQ